MTGLTKKDCRNKDKLTIIYEDGSHWKTISFEDSPNYDELKIRLKPENETKQLSQQQCDILKEFLSGGTIDTKVCQICGKESKLRSIEEMQNITCRHCYAYHQKYWVCVDSPELHCYCETCVKAKGMEKAMAKKEVNIDQEL